MSKRLQVLLPDQEMMDIQRLAKWKRVTVSEWVRPAGGRTRNQIEGGSAGSGIFISHR
jgi:hypothetical protein